MTRSKVAAKYINVLDRVVEVPVSRAPIIPVVRKVRPSVPQFRVHQVVRAWFDGAMSEFDDRTLGDLVGRGLQGE